MPTEGKMTENGDISMGSIYELNQQAYDKVYPLNDEELHTELDNIFEWLHERRCNYSMLLCHERRDYTIFNYIEKSKRSYQTGTNTDLRECLQNRGNVLDITYLQDQDAWEIWIRIREDGEHQNYMYMLFDCEPFVIEV